MKLMKEENKNMEINKLILSIALIGNKSKTNHIKNTYSAVKISNK